MPCVKPLFARFINREERDYKLGGREICLQEKETHKKMAAQRKGYS